MVFLQAALSLTALLQLGVANRVDTSDALMSSDWWEKYCIQFGFKENCEQIALKNETDCLEHYDKMAAATTRTAYGVLRFSRTTPACSKFFAAKEDIIYQEQNPPPKTIKLAAQACEPKAMEVCVTATCPTYCALTKKKDCDCNQICKQTSEKMWGTGSIECADGEKWSECIDRLHSKLKEDGRIAELEAISREHILKCVCASRMKDDSTCYQGSQGITPGQNWCEFNKNPSWRLLLESNKPTTWKSDWVSKPQCSRKEIELA